jgi:hypothetical protein
MGFVILGFQFVPGAVLAAGFFLFRSPYTDYSLFTDQSEVPSCSSFRLSLIL